jgi:hypothetical protein
VARGFAAFAAANSCRFLAIISSRMFIIEVYLFHG